MELEVRSRKASYSGMPGPLLGSLRTFIVNSMDIRPPEEIELEALEMTESLLEKFESNNKASTAAPAIPTFFKPKPKPDSLGSLVKKQARARREQVKAESVLDEPALRQIWYLIEEYAVHDGDENEIREGDTRINYDGFSQVATRAREVLGPIIDPYFKASVFARFSQDGDGCISAPAFAAYLGTRTSMHGIRLQLTAFDPDDSGVLPVYALEDYLRSLVMELPPLESIEDFEMQYARIAARKFMFFHGHNGGVRIRDLLTSPLMQELMELKNPDLADPAQQGALMSNWFSLQSTRRVHNTFQALDEDMNGLLSRSEFSQIANGTMSPLFIQRIFEEHVMRQRDPLAAARGRVRGREGPRDEMDLTAFTDFVLAWDHRAHPAAVKYFFPILDLQKIGAITPAELYVFFREIHAMWVAMGEYADLAIYDVVDEILDMIKPARHPDITPEDLATSGMSGIFFSMLSDVKQFYDYNYRENFMHSDDDS